MLVSPELAELKRNDIPDGVGMRPTFRRPLFVLPGVLTFVR